MIKILEYCEVERSEIFARTEPCANAEATVRNIIADVRARGDEALLEYEETFSNNDRIAVAPGELAAALGALDPAVRAGLDQGDGQRRGDQPGRQP